MCSGDVQHARGSSEPALAAYRAGENNGCTAVRFAYGGKGFGYDDVPLSMITGLSCLLNAVSVRRHFMSLHFITSPVSLVGTHYVVETG